MKDYFCLLCLIILLNLPVFLLITIKTLCDYYADVLYAEYIMRNAGLEEAQTGIRIARRISITSDMQIVR